MKLNLGCGREILKGYTNCDIEKSDGVDMVFDLDKGIPFKDSTITEVLFKNTIEHVKNPIFVMEEIWRVCKNGSIVTVEAPHIWNKVLDGKLWHLRSGINAYTFISFDPNNIKYNQKYGYNVKMKFKIKNIKYTLFNFRFLEKHLEKHIAFSEYYFGRIFGINLIRIELEVLK